MTPGGRCSRTPRSPPRHSVITGTAVPGATLKITKDFTLYTAPVKQATTPVTSTAPIAVPTHLESSMTVPASGKFTWDVNPSIRPQSAYYADGEHTGPNGFVNESYTITCTAADGTVLETNHVTVDKGQTRQPVALLAGHRRRLRAGHARADAGRSGDVRRVHAGRGEGLHGVHDRHRHLHRG